MLMCMRTNLVLDDDLLREATLYARVKTKRAVVQEAMEVYVATRREARKRETYRERLAGVRAQAAKTPVRTSAHTMVRADRERVR